MSQIMIVAFAMIAFAPSVVVVPSTPPQRVGTCLGTAGDTFDLEKLLFLETDSVVVEGPLEKIRVTLAGERVKIVDLKPPREGQYITNIADEIEPKDNLDVELKLAFLSGDLVLYWKETYKHRIYRQGLFRFLNGRPISLCEGRGGTTSYE